MFHRRRHCRPEPICCPPNIMPTQVAPTQISPTQEVVKTNVFNTVVPHVHPIHTTTVNQHVYHHQHYFPRTFSEVNQVFETSTSPMGMTSPMNMGPMNMTSPMNMTNPMGMTSPMNMGYQKPGYPSKKCGC